MGVSPMFYSALKKDRGETPMLPTMGCLFAPIAPVDYNRGYVY